MERTDIGKSGDLDFAEFVHYAIEHEKQLMVVFKSFDVNKDGKVDAGEILSSFKKLGVAISESEALKLLKRMDRDGSLSISFEEWRDYLLFHPSCDISDIIKYWKHSKESKGGRSFQKLGFVDMNLAEVAGVGICSRRHLLQGYDTKHRQDNSMLNVTLEMTLLSGDPCFRRAASVEEVEYQPSVIEQLDSVSMVAPPASALSQCPMKDDQSCGSVASVSSGFESLPRKQRTNLLTSDHVTGCVTGEGEGPEESPPMDSFEPGHSRNSSYASQQSKASGYSSLHSHSRQNSAESAGHIRNPSSGSTYSDMGFPGQPKSIDRKRPTSRKPVGEESRVDATRVNVDQLISEIIESTTFEADEIADNMCGVLTLVINKDGTAGLGSHVMTPGGVRRQDSLGTSHSK